MRLLRTHKNRMLLRNINSQKHAPPSSEVGCFRDPSNSHKGTVCFSIIVRGTEECCGIAGELVQNIQQGGGIHGSPTPQHEPFRKKNGIAGAPSRNEPIIALWDSIVFIQPIDVFGRRDVHIKVRRVVLD